MDQKIISLELMLGNSLSFIIKTVVLWGYCLLLCACREEKQIIDKRQETLIEDGIVKKQPYLWKVDASEKENDYIWELFIPAKYKNIVAVGGTQPDRRGVILGLDINTGKEIWRWDDYITHNGSIGFSSNQPINNNQKCNVILLQKDNELYAIDLQNGQTLWKRQIERGIGAGFKLIAISGDSFYFEESIVNDDLVQEPTLFEGQISNGSLTKLLNPEIDEIQFFNGFYGDMHDPSIFEKNGTNYAFLQYSENVDLYSKKVFNYVSTFNLTKGEYELNKLKIGDTAYYDFSGTATIENDVALVNVDFKLFGIDIFSGEILWKHENFTGNGDGHFVFRKYKGKFYLINGNGSIGRTWCIEPSTGNILWSHNGSVGFGDTLHFLDDVLYFVSRGNSALTALDTNTGEILMQMKSPDTDFFMAGGGLEVFPGEKGEKGKIIVSSHLNVYCYEAIR